MNSTHTICKTTHLPNWPGRRPCTLLHPQAVLSKAEKILLLSLPVKAEAAHGPAGPIPLLPWLRLLEFPSPEPFWLYWPPYWPFNKRPERWNIPQQGLSPGHYLHGCLSAVPLYRKALQWPCYWKPGPSFTFSLSCSIFIHSIYLYPSYTVMYWFILFIFSPCGPPPPQNRSSPEVGALICFDD